MRHVEPEVVMDSIPTAVEAIAAGSAVVVVDDHNRENEGDVVFAAQLATAELTGFTVRHTSGVLCAPMPGDRADALGLPPMTAVNQDPKGTAYTVTCDARQGITTGISAADRAHTVRVLASTNSGPQDITRPGHVLPLRAVAGGVRQRPGHTEAAVDLCTLAGLEPVGVIAELVHDDGSMMRLPALREFATEHGLPLISIDALVAYLQRHPPAAGSQHIEEAPTHLRQVAAVSEPVVIPMLEGRFAVRGWQIPDADGVSMGEHLSVTALDQTTDQPLKTSAEPLVRVHSECLTGDVFGSYRCDCGAQLHRALAILARQGGTLVYVRRHEGRGIGLVNKLRAYRLQDGGADTVEANEMLGLPPEARDWGAAAAVLHELGLHRVRLMTNNPAKEVALKRWGIEVTELVAHEVPARAENHEYLVTKRDRMNHRLLHLENTPQVQKKTAIGEDIR